MSTTAAPFAIRDDWYLGTIPPNIVVGEGVYIETSRSFLRFRSREERGLVVGAGASLCSTTLDVGACGRVEIGDHALIASAMILCDVEVTIGAMSMLAWNVVVMDSYRGGRGRWASGPEMEDAARAARPVHIGSNVWLGFESCVLPGVTIGDNSVVGARAVVWENVAANCIVAGNPARVIRHFPGYDAEEKYVLD